MPSDNGAKERLLQTATELLYAGQDPAAVTTRMLGAKAGVNTALINYYFGGKDGLFNAAVDLCMAEIFDSIVNSGINTHPVDKISGMAKAISDVAFANAALAKIALRRDTTHGCTDTLELLLPALRGLYGATRGEAALRRTAAELVLPLQCMLLSHAEYTRYLGVDLADAPARHQLIDDIVADILRGPYAPEHERDT